tara:strand:+ start:2227 stop:2580 length:354 start_codon:yes stop_codon:yes gene_type:complete
MVEQSQNSPSENQTQQSHLDQEIVSMESAKAYWHANLRLLGKLLLVWFVVSFGFGILLVDWLDQYSFFGFKLGFWFAQQGAIYVFVGLIFIYAWRIHNIEREFGIDDDDPINPGEEK